MSGFGTIGFGAGEAIALPALDLAAPANNLIPDAVMLIEFTATSGLLTFLPGEEGFGVSGFGAPGDVLRGGSVAIDLSDADWTSLPTDARPNVHFAGRADGVTVDRALPLLPGADRRVAAALSEVAIANADGAYDAVDRDLAVDGRQITIKLLSHPSRPYAEARAIFTGLGRGWRADATTLRFQAVSLGYALDQPMLGLYGGTGGADGGAELKGKPIQEVWGVCRNIPGQLVDATRLIYRLHARQVLAVDGAYERGATITPGVQRASYAVLEATSPTAGTWDSVNDAAGTFVRLGSSPDGPVTFDVRGDASATYSASLPGMMRRIAARGGAVVSAAAFDAMEAQAPGAAGLLLAEGGTYADALSALAAGGALWWGDDGSGVIGVSRLAVPVAEGAVSLSEEVILDELEPMDAPAVVWRITVRYRRNWLPLSGTDILPEPTVAEARRLELSEPSRSVVLAEPARRERNANAVEITVESLLDVEADALSLASNLMALYSAGRGMWRVPLGAAGHGLSLGQNVVVSWPRFGLRGGRAARVVAQSARGRDCAVTVFG
jgi:hypothetical protein